MNWQIIFNRQSTVGFDSQWSQSLEAAKWPKARSACWLGGGPGPAPERPPGVGVWGMPSKIFLKKSCKNTAFERFLSNISQHKIGTHISNSQYKTVNVRKVSLI